MSTVYGIAGINMQLIKTLANITQTQKIEEETPIMPKVNKLLYLKSI